VLRLRRIIVRLFWVVPIIYSIPAVSVPPFIFRLIQGTSGYAYRASALGPRWVALLWIARLLLAIIAISPGAICISSAIAVVQFLREKQSARTWAIACGVGLLVCFIPLLATSVIFVLMARHTGGHSAGLLGVPFLGLIQMAAGILILAAFLPRDSVNSTIYKNTRPARVKGDGTASLSLYVAFAVMVGGLSLGNSLCERWSLQAHLPPSPSFLHLNLIWLGAFILALASHEFGHILAGQMVGMTLLSLRIGPFHVALEEGRWRVVLPRSWKCVFSGGVSMISKRPLCYSRWQAISSTAGGVLANLFIGGLALLGLLTAKGAAYEQSWEFLGQAATINLALFLANLIPAREAQTYSDGARIYQILTGSVLEEYRHILAMAQATTVSSLRPKDFDIELIDRITARNTPGLDHSFLLLVACDYYFDRGQIESAGGKLREAEALSDQETTYWTERCGAIVLRAACLLTDLAMAEKWWQRSQSAKSRNPRKKNRFPACAYFTVTCRLSEAEDAWRAEFERANRQPESGGRAFDFHYLGHLREMLDEATRSLTA